MVYLNGRWGFDWGFLLTFILFIFLVSASVSPLSGGCRAGRGSFGNITDHCKIQQEKITKRKTCARGISKNKFKLQFT